MKGYFVKGLGLFTICFKLVETMAENKIDSPMIIAFD
jgi:hypothetical protein